jgi:hypothetical protein
MSSKYYSFKKFHHEIGHGERLATPDQFESLIQPMVAVSECPIEEEALCLPMD